MKLGRLRRLGIVAATCGIAVGLTASAAHGASIIFDLDFEFSGATAPEGAAPWVRITFDDATGNPNSVELTIDALGLIGGQSGENVGAIYLNFDPALDPTQLTFNVVDNSASVPDAINTGINLFQADGDGSFDINFEMPPPPGNPALRLTGGEAITYELVYPSAIDASSFDFESQPPQGGQGTFRAAAHIMSIGTDGEQSGWIGVPEPTTGVMLGLSLLLGCWLQRRS